MKLIYLKWCDACSNTAWHTKKDALDWFKNKSKSHWMVEQVGWLAEETKQFIGLIGRKTLIGEDEEWGQLQKIPKTWILKRINLTKYIK